MTGADVSTSEVVVAAVDLGASSGRVMLCHVGSSRLELTEVHRFPNRPMRVHDTLRWNIFSLYRSVLDGLRLAVREAGHLDGVGIDSWAVDYGLMDASGALMGNPVHYRDQRTDGVMDRVLTEIGAERVYATTGIQFLPFNTLYQLLADATRSSAHRFLLIPDLLSYWLTGVEGAEITNASTTQLLDTRTRTWSTDLMRQVELDPALFPPLRQPGDRVGDLLGSVRGEIRADEPIPQFAVASHDTASAVVAVPAQGERFGYISCGTWSLVGLELDKPVLTEASQRANFTNELGVDGTVRYLRNVMGLWLLQESLRTWQTNGIQIELDDLLSEAGRVAPLRVVVNPDDPAFLPPGDMPARIAEAARQTGQPVPGAPAEIVRCILDSLALAHRRTLRSARDLAGRDVDVVHIVGGGARNELLCQLTADATGRPVLAGPVEATALGNGMIQARALGAAGADLSAIRQLIADTQPLRRYEPSGDPTKWAAAERQVWS